MRRQPPIGGHCLAARHFASLAECWPSPADPGRAAERRAPARTPWPRRPCCRLSSAAAPADACILWRNVVLAALPALAASTSTPAPAAGEQAAESESDLPETGLDTGRTIALGAGFGAIIVVMFMAWLAVVMVHAMLHGAHPDQADAGPVGGPQQAGPQPCPGAAEGSGAAATCRAPAPAEDGNPAFVAVPVSGSDCVGEEVWRPPKEGAPPSEVAVSRWDGPSGAPQACTLRHDGTWEPGSTAALQSLTAPAAARAAEARFAASETQGRTDGVSGLASPRYAEIDAARRQQGLQVPAGHPTQVVALDASGAALVAPPGALPSPAPLCWDSCVSLVCCSLPGAPRARMSL